MMMYSTEEEDNKKTKESFSGMRIESTWAGHLTGIDNNGQGQVCEERNKSYVRGQKDREWGMENGDILPTRAKNGDNSCACEWAYKLCFGSPHCHAQLDSYARTHTHTHIESGRRGKGHPQTHTRVCTQIHTDIHVQRTHIHTHTYTLSRDALFIHHNHVTPIICFAPEDPPF